MKLAINEDLKNPVICHLDDISNPSQLGLHEEGFHASHTALSKKILSCCSRYPQIKQKHLLYIYLYNKMWWGYCPLCFYGSNLFNLLSPCKALWIFTRVSLNPAFQELINFGISFDIGAVRRKSKLVFNFKRLLVWIQELFSKISSQPKLESCQPSYFTKN